LGCGASYPIRGGIPLLLPPYENEEQFRYLASYEQLASDDLTVPLENRREVRHSVLIDFIGDVRGKKVLDIGSSAATYLRQLDAEFKVAFDLVYAYVAAIPGDTHVVPVCGDAEFLPFRPGFFDVIVISDALEHFLKPEAVIEHLRVICRPDTRIIVHVPWEEDIAPYRDSKYEFAHLRSFSSYTFALMWRDFEIRRARSTYPSLEEPFVFKLDGIVPQALYRRFVYWYFHRGWAHREYAWRSRWIEELPKRERGLLYLYKPKFRLFELRRLDLPKKASTLGSLIGRIVGGR
jgi:SAM-dependent methyltransferase